MCFVWTMTYGTNYTLTTVRKLIFSAGHKINRHSGRNIYPTMIQSKYQMTEYYRCICEWMQTHPKNNSMWGNMIFREFISTWLYWSAHISPSESFDRLFQKIWSIPSIFGSFVWAQWNRYLVRNLFSSVLTVVSAIPRITRCNFFIKIFYKNESYELSCWIYWICLFNEIIQNTEGFNRKY